jgi:phosphoenolpyruvate-protein phosphotransferase (PTS system enzyme I)
MEIRRGIGVSSGYAIGEAYVIDREEFRINRRPIGPKDVDREIERFRKSVEAATAEIRKQIEALPKRIREVAGSILEAQVHNLQDKLLHEEIVSEIRKNLSTAEYAASRTIRRKIKALEDSGAEAFVKRVLSDFIELEKAILRNLLGGKRDDTAQMDGKNIIIVAHDLSPGQALRLDRKKVMGILTEVGGLTSHTAIVAKSIGIPAVVGVEGVTSDITGGDVVVLDGTGGTVIISPDEGTLKRYQAMERNFTLLEKQRAKELHDLPAVTIDGTHIEIFANIESPEEIPEAIDHGAEGIGLYRTEFLFLENRFHPTEKDHLEAYARAVTLLGKRKIIIRTVDLGADKMPMDGIPRESNPFLGTRAIRLCFEQPEMFKTQLRAILKSTARGTVCMMIPMISSLSEVVQVKEAIEDVRRELRRDEEHAGDGMELGIMIEIPSAAIIADLLAPHVDFLSVGTNDLIAYSVAVDRANERVAPLYQPGHPAVLRLLKHVIDAGSKHGKTVSVCGEMSSDLNFTLFLLGIGLRNFSVAHPVIPDLKKLIRTVSIDEAKAVAEKAFTFNDGREVLEFLKGETRRFLPDA